MVASLNCSSAYDSVPLRPGQSFYSLVILGTMYFLMVLGSTAGIHAWLRPV